MTHEEETAMEIKVEAVRAEIKLRIEALERLLDEREKASVRALQLQAEEYHRRLDALNHENERILNVQNSCVPSDVYQVQHKVLSDQVCALQSFKDNQQGRQVFIPIVISFVISLTFLLLNYFLSR